MAADETQHEVFVQHLAASTKRLYAFIRTMVLNDENDAEEVFQSTCMAIWRKFDQYDPEGDFGAWACRMAYFEVLRQSEKRKRIRLMSEQALAALAEAAQPVSDQINERREALADCLKQLPSGDLALIEQRYFDGRKPKQIARELDRSVHAVYRELSRVHGLLLRCVERKLAHEN
jgi:RNA polymerase sigma-70 factor (ECF subfamily)